MLLSHTHAVFTLLRKKKFSQGAYPDQGKQVKGGHAKNNYCNFIPNILRT